MKPAPTLNVWESMGLDAKLSGKAVAMRKATSKMMEDNISEINKHVESSTFPFFMLDKVKELQISGLMIKGFGSPGLSIIDASSIVYEMGRKDGSFGLFFLAHTNLGMAVINALADEE